MFHNGDSFSKENKISSKINTIWSGPSVSRLVGYILLKGKTFSIMWKLLLKTRTWKQNYSTSSPDWINAVPFNSIPGPKMLPLIGNIWRFLPMIGDLNNLDTTQLHVELQSRYGDIVKLEGIPGKAPLIFLSNAKDLAEVFHTEGEFPVRDAMQSTRYYRQHIRPEPYTRVGHLVDQGHQWKKFRTRVNQLMMKRSNIDVYKPVVDKVTDEFVERIKLIRNDSNEVPADFMKELKKWALEVLGAVALDHRFKCLQSVMSREARDITQAVADFHESTYPLDMLSPYLWKYLSNSAFHKMVSALDHLHSISESYVLRAEQTKSSSILQKLIDEGEDGRDLALVMAVDMFLAGVETIAGMAATLLYALSKFPNSQEWLVEKVRSEPLQGQPFVQAFIKESMRMWPVAIGTLRTAGRDIVLSGYRVPKGTEIVTSNYIMCRNPLYFETPLEFLPQRWLNSHRLSYSQYAFAPFGIGARSCVGRRLAMLELETFLVKILYNFKVEYRHGEVAFESKFLNVISSPLQFTFIDRNS